MVKEEAAKDQERYENDENIVKAEELQMEIKPEVLVQNQVEEDVKVPLDCGSEGGDVRSNNEDEQVDV